jgi:hypothetical protein
MSTPARGFWLEAQAALTRSLAPDRDPAIRRAFGGLGRQFQIISETKSQYDRL